MICMHYKNGFYKYKEKFRNLHISELYRIEYRSNEGTLSRPLILSLDTLICLYVGLSTQKILQNESYQSILLNPLNPTQIQNIAR